VNNLPTAKFVVGNEIDLSDLEVTVNYTDGSGRDPETLDLDEVNFYLRDPDNILVVVDRTNLKFTPEDAGTYSLYVSYGGVSVTITFEVAPDLALPTFVPVGTSGITYTVPVAFFGSDPDGDTAEVDGGYSIAATETTYGLWVEVREWAEDNDYVFQNPGLPGSHKSAGVQWGFADADNPPAVDESNENQPVTFVSWRDVIVWTNALSELAGRAPVYRASEESTTWYKDSSADIDAAVETGNDGYRLPTSYEWEMAARWIGTTLPTGFTALTTTVASDTYYWTPGNYASGATKPAEHVSGSGWAQPLIDNKIATLTVAWHRLYDNDSIATKEVGPVTDMIVFTQKTVNSHEELVLPDDDDNVEEIVFTANQLGLYDMSGNVFEWTFTWYKDLPGGSDSGRVVLKGGGLWDNWGVDVEIENDRDKPTTLWVSAAGIAPTINRKNNYGFRLVINPTET